MNAITRCLDTYWSSSIGKKLIVALTGLVLVLFLAGHMSGNLLVFVGPEAFNDYAQLLHHLLHGVGLWIARIGLLVAVGLHIAATIALTRQNKAARKQYEYQATIQASKSSRIMIWTGLTILAFVIYHLMHFTVRVGNEYNNPQLYTDLVYMAKTGEYRQNAWKMVIDGFSVWYVVLFYLIAMTMLCSHLSHGVGAIFQTLGLRSKKSASSIDLISKAYAVFIWVGFVSIPVAIFFGFGR
ncbi:MAG: succinate dehydrogenase cytochrome b subunit [Verrucomicrobiaceae bacterium]|nr:MAG: succinate dehydrogenase cytochrome b subunit [Verrucomicrobiaceae bacterium]